MRDEENDDKFVQRSGSFMLMQQINFSVLGVAADEEFQAEVMSSSLT